jgi:glycosyltransferase involved in cell wall biosynthesis
MDPVYKKLANPILLLSDAPEQFTGLARIGRDLASLLSTMPQFRVGYLGRGGSGSRRFPWTQYSFPEDHQWGEEHLERVWDDFSEGENGIVMSLWDASRMLWFAGEGRGLPVKMQRFLGAGRNFKKWGYFPVDATGPDGASLGIEMATAVAGYDKVLAASEWGASILRNSGRNDADWMPHGIFSGIFMPAADPRPLLGWKSDDIIVGCVMTNQARKDWPVAFECIATLKQKYGNKLKLWVHTDVMIRHWNLYALASDYGIAECLDVTLELSDEQMVLRYSASDCTILPSGGEGFGFPIAESLMCGTACVVTGYAAGQEIVHEACRIAPAAYRVDTSHNVRRAVLSGAAFAAAAHGEIEAKRLDPFGRSQDLRSSVRHLGWENLKGPWSRWLLEGLGK